MGTGIGIGRAGLAACLAAAAALGAEAPGRVTPALRVDTAIYDVNAGVLQFAYTFANPGDSVLYLDSQVPPRAVLEGSTLSLTFSRSATDADGVMAGGRAPAGDAPAPGGEASAPPAAIRPDDFPPHRIAGRQSYQGQRRLDRVLGSWEARPKFTALKLKIDYYPERSEGAGPMFVAERGARAVAPVRAVVRRGKPPVPSKPVRIRVPK